MRIITADARRGDKTGWDVHVHGIGVATSRTLAGAEAAVKALLDVAGLDGQVAIYIQPDLGPLAERVNEVRARTAQVQQELIAAARDARELALQLRADGLSVTDAAHVLGVSRARVSQLTS
ncbi:MAG: hypothetical protein WD152_03355 [Nitriliruptoraceae bacterium]